tara:strand:+ start:117 stop:464 length:348 start_codon:yes stop_codon:yes gene_type:complete
LVQERQSIIAQAASRGLQLSEDGKSWVPINSESSNLPLGQSNVAIVKKLPSDICPDDHNIRIVKIHKLTNFQAIVVVIYYLMGVLAVIGLIYLLIALLSFTYALLQIDSGGLWSV